jgi:3-deoxy-D-manno-octulosonic-acid transferase
MTPGLYNFGWWLLRPFLPVILRCRVAAGKEIAVRLPERYGQKNDQDPIKPGALWLHAVSVGETVAAIGLVQRLAAHDQTAHFLITTNTVTAAALVEQHRHFLPDVTLSHRFQPLDHPTFVDQFLYQYQPKMAVFMESDFWPNLICRTAKADIPVIFASAQMSDAAFRRWRGRQAFARRIFATPKMVLAVSQSQADQFNALGTARDKLVVLGSLKTGAVMQPDKALCKILKTAIGSRKVFLAASTHEGEDNSIIEAARRLGSGWLTIIAPRHPTRGAAIAAAVDNAPQASKNKLPDKHNPVFIMDQLGKMGSLLSLADVVFLGASLVPKGGHNPLEPAAFGLPIITGPHIFKNNAEFDGLRAAGVVFDLTEDAEGDVTTTMVKLVKEQGLKTAQRQQIAHAARSYARTAATRVDIAAAKIYALLDSQA